MRQNPHVRICGGPGSATTLVYPTVPTVASAIVMPSLSNSPWIRGAPQVGLAWHIWRMSAWAARGMRGRRVHAADSSSASRAKRLADATGARCRV